MKHGAAAAVYISGSRNKTEINKCRCGKDSHERIHGLTRANMPTSVVVVIHEWINDRT